MNKKWTMLAGGALAVALLAGCGSKADDSAAGAAPASAAADGQQGAAQEGGQGAGQGGGAWAMGTLGKIKSVDGNTITIYKSSFEPGQGGGGRQRGEAPSSGDAGAAQGGDGQSGQPPSGDPPQQGAGDGQGGQGEQGGGQGGQRPDMANMFSEETEQITVTDATKIYKTEMTDGQRTETEIALADLKAEDIITVTLKEGTQEAESIRIGGGFGGGGFGGGGMRGGQGQGQGDGQQEGGAQQQSGTGA